jgi:CHAD domain-containing protein
LAKTVDKLFEKYVEKFEAEFLRAINTEDEEAIHDLRVAIKKIRALFLFLKESGMADIKSDYPYLGNLKKIFKKAGKLREVHIHKNLYEQYRKRLGQDFPELEEHLRNLEEESRNAYHEYMPGIQFRKFYRAANSLQKEIQGISRKKLNKKLYEFIRVRVEQCHQYMFEAHYEQHLHQIRKYMKHIRFIIGQQIGDVHKVFEDELSFEDTKKVEDILGEWHDRDEFRKLLEEYRNTLTQAGDAGETASRLEAYLEAVNQDIREDVKKLRPELIHLFALMKNLLERNKGYAS